MVGGLHQERQLNVCDVICNLSIDDICFSKLTSRERQYCLFVSQSAYHITGVTKVTLKALYQLDCISQFIEIIIDIDRYGLFQIPKGYEAREHIQFNIA